MTIAHELLDPFERLLSDVAGPAMFRRAQRGDALPAVWTAIEQSGFADALVAVEHGGVGLTPEDVETLLLACGAHLLAPALGHTMIARALLSAAGQERPAEPLILWPEGAGGELQSTVAPPAIEGRMALVQRGEVFALRTLKVSGLADGYGVAVATLGDAVLGEFTLTAVDSLTLVAAVTAVSMAGAMDRLVTMTVDFANERHQFGRPIGKFQAIQHQLSVAAEHVACAAMACQFAFASSSLALSPVRVGIAKSIANDAADVVCAAAHAVHGAIGVSEEYDLQLYTRRLRRWQMSFGSSRFWTRRLADGRLDARGTSVDFLRTL